MNRFSVRALAPVLAFAIATSFAARVGADEEWKAPDHSGSDMAIEVGTLPDGWGLVPEDAKSRPEAEKAISDALEALAKEQGIPEKERSLVVRSVTTPDGASATLVLVDLWVDPAKFPAALAARAKEKGWAFQEMASPARLLVVAAPEAVREKVLAVQRAVAGRKIARNAWRDLASGSQDSARALAKTALGFEPGAAFAHLVQAYLLLPSRKEGEPKPAPEAYDPSLAEFKVALDDKAAAPLDAPERAQAKADYGNNLLTRGGNDEVARDFIKTAIDEVKAVNPHAPLLTGLRYNLACAHARLKDKAAAYATLKALLEDIKGKPVEGISEWWEKDPDFDSLHADPEWAALVASYGEKKGS